MFSLYASLLCLMALMLVQESLFPLIQGVCSLRFSIQQACLAYGLYKGVCSICLLFSKLVLLLIWSRDFVTFSLYCWSPAHFWSIIFLHLIKKKKLASQLERETRERCSLSWRFLLAIWFCNSWANFEFLSSLFLNGLLRGQWDTKFWVTILLDYANSRGVPV
jgi:hypothetical protein